MAESKAQAPAGALKNVGTRQPNMKAFGAEAPKPEAAPRPQQGDAGETGEKAVQPDDIRDLSGKFRLALGENVTREVSADELKESYLKRQEAEEAVRQAHALLQQNAGHRAIAEALEKAPQQVRDKVYRVLQGQDIDQPSKPAQRQSDDDDLMSLLGDDAASGSSDDLRKALQQLQQNYSELQARMPVLDFLAQDKQEQLVRERQSTLADEVRAEIEQFDQFNPEKVGTTKPRDFLTQAVLNDYVAQGGKGDAKELKALTLKWIQEYAGSVPAPQPQERATRSQEMSPFDDFPIPQPATGAQIQQGNALADLLRQSRS